MTLSKISKQGDEYYTPKYAVDLLLPYLSKKEEITKIWCPFDKKEQSKYYESFTESGYEVFCTHIDDGQDFFEYEPDFEFDAIISNPPFSRKNEIFKKVIEENKPWALLMSATSVQSASFIQILSEETHMNTIMFDKRISFNGERPSFPSWYFTGKLLDKNEFYLFGKSDPRKMIKENDR